MSLNTPYLNTTQNFTKLLYDDNLMHCNMLKISVCTSIHKHEIAIPRWYNNTSNDAMQLCPVNPLIKHFKIQPTQPITRHTSPYCPRSPSHHHPHNPASHHPSKVSCPSIQHYYTFMPDRYEGGDRPSSRNINTHAIKPTISTSLPNTKC